MLYLCNACSERQNHILTDLNQRGIPNPLGKQWNKANICYMLQNPLYTGVYKVSDYGENPCPALVSQELFERVQKMKQVSLNRARENKTNYDYILTGKMTCLQCGASVCGCSMGHGKNHYYLCHKHCGHRLRAEELHERVINALHKYLTPEKRDEMAAAAFAEYQKDDEPAAEQKLLEQELADVSKQLDNAVKAVLDGYGSEHLKAKLQELEKRQKEIRELLDNIAPPPPKFTEEHFRVALDMVIKKAQSNDLRQLLDTVVNRIYIDDQEVTIYINLTDEANTPPLEQVRFWVKSESRYCPTIM